MQSEEVRGTMEGRGFTLAPHPEVGAVPPVRITGGVRLQSRIFFIHFQLDGRVEEVRLPPLAETPTRRDRLWEETCFEFFIAKKNSPRYWEFNISPSGDWNAFRFSNYREGMQEERAIPSLPVRVQEAADVLLLSAECDLSRLLEAGRGIDVAISAVIKTEAGEPSYWALAHAGNRPDFHRREGFQIAL